MKKTLIAILVICMLVSLCACSSQNSAAQGGSSSGANDLAGKSVIGIVTGVEGSVVTLGIRNGGMPGNGGERPERPDGGNGERPERPDGGNGERPELPEGGNGERPELPADWQGFEGADGAPGFTPPGDGADFGDGGETITVDLSGADITSGSDTVSVGDIKAGDIIAVTFDDSGKAVSASTVNFGGAPFGGPGKPAGD